MALAIIFADNQYESTGLVSADFHVLLISCFNSRFSVFKGTEKACKLKCSPQPREYVHLLNDKPIAWKY